MDMLRDAIASSPGLWLAAGGLAIGLVFGFVVLRSNFCTMGAISDIHAFGDYRRFRTWLLAAAVAIAGTQGLDWAGIAVLSKSMYLGGSLNWLGHVLGGLMFGYGMVFAGGCASRNLARVGAGDLRSLLTLIVMGLFAYMAVGGLLGPLRDALERATAIPLAGTTAGTHGIGNLVGAALSLPAAVAGLLASAVIVGAALVYCFMDKSFRGSATHVAAGLGVGLCVVLGWLLTGLAFDDLADKPLAPGSLTFVRPTADTVEWLERFTAAMIPGFGVASVLGTILGAHFAARSMGRFQLTTFTDVADTRRNLYGAALMGVGGVMALGCTMGQGITGVSTLALGSFLTFAAIVAGGFLGMRRMERLLAAEA